MVENVDYVFKIVLTGDFNVGKSHIIAKYATPDSKEKIPTTIGVDFKVVNMTINNKKIRLQIWDTAGQEKFKSIITPFYRGAHGIFIVCDMNNIDSIRNIDYWIEQVRMINEYAQLMIIGNKIDLMRKNEYSYLCNYREILSCSEKHKIPYHEVSALQGIEIINMFEILVRKILDNLQYETIKIRIPKVEDHEIIETKKPDSTTKCCKIM